MAGVFVLSVGRAGALSLAMLSACVRCGSDVDMVGAWRLSDDSQMLAHNVGRYAPIPGTTLTFRADHTVTVENMPDWYWLGRPGGRKESGSGEWSLGGRDRTVVVLRIRLRRTGALWQSELRLQDGADGRRLVARLGDPDQRENFVFEQISEQEAHSETR